MPIPLELTIYLFNILVSEVSSQYGMAMIAFTFALGLVHFIARRPYKRKKNS